MPMPINLIFMTKRSEGNLSRHNQYLKTISEDHEHDLGLIKNATVLEWLELSDEEANHLRQLYRKKTHLHRPN